MKVALDATPLLEPAGGIRRYVEELVKALAAHYPNDEFWLLSDQYYQHPHLPGVRHIAGTPAGLARRWWSYGLPRLLARERFDLFHGTDFAVPYWPATPSVLTLHDLTPWRFGGSSRVRRRTPWLLRLGLATMVITPSEAVRREALEYFHLSPEEVVAVPLAAASHFAPCAAPPPPRPYFFAFGGRHARKNIDVAVAAWRQLRRRHGVDLVLAGDLPTHLRPTPADEGLRLLGHVPDQDLPRWYSQAVAFLYPSFDEGFGLPVLEAMQCGASVITSRAPALIELCAGNCLHAEADDVRQWIEAMEALLTDSCTRQIWGRRGLARAGAFSWQRTAALTREVYQTAIRRHHG